ncbi:MAG: hypothetical protein KJ072_06075 [Verrucomicrobia bacterium]|nr:hypothetical protein [Verrucomicrobiota bacterium]
MPRPKGSKNKPKSEDLDALPVNAENFVKLQSVRAGYQSRIDELKAEITKVDKAMLRFAEWMEQEAKRIRQQAK